MPNVSNGVFAATSAKLSTVISMAKFAQISAINLRKLGSTQSIIEPYSEIGRFALASRRACTIADVYETFIIR